MMQRITAAPAGTITGGMHPRMPAGNGRPAAGPARARRRSRADGARPGPTG